MIPVRSFQGKACAVFGLAKSGLATVRALTAGGAEVYVWDDWEPARNLAETAGVFVRPWDEWPWECLSALIVSPGVPLTHPKPHAVVVKARECGIEVIGDIELFAREIRPNPVSEGRAPIIAVTGTNGKSTTTALIGHILNSCGYQAQVGGNIGRPALDLALPSAKTIYVLEVSSFQIDLAPSLHADVSVLTNISPDHIDRHGSFDNYVAIKSRLIRQTTAGGLRIIGVDDAPSAALFTALVAGGFRATPVSSGKILSRGIFVLGGQMYEAQFTHTAKLMDVRVSGHLPGTHNWQNAALAMAATKSFAKNARFIAAAIDSFPGLPHRLEDVGRIGNLRLVNDSKATNADAAAKALACFDQIYWILGGRPKTDGIASLSPYFSRVRKAYLIGEATESFAAVLEDQVPYVKCGTLDAAFVAAAEDAAKSRDDAPVVLLSPACASFDQFANFEARGDTFRAMAEQLVSVSYQEAS